MRVVVETRGMTSAAGWLRARSDALRRFATGPAGVAAWSDGLRDPVLRAGVVALSGAASTLLEVLALDQEVLADRVHAGALLYDDVEAAVAAAARP